MSVWWSIVLPAMGFVATWMLGNRWKSGWLVGVAQNAAWLVYAAISEQWGFIASSVVFTVINIRNFVKWQREDASDVKEASTR